MIRYACMLFVAATILSGCSKQYVYTAPTSEAGITCVSHCQERQAACRDRMLAEADEAKLQCEKSENKTYRQCTYEAEQAYANCQETAKTDYYACLKYSQNRNACREAACVKESCKKQSCYQHVSYAQCEGDFRSCFQQCGGRIEEAE